MSLTDILVGIDKSEVAALKGEPLVKTVTYSLEELAVHEFYEDMARTYCTLSGLNPDELIDVESSKVPGLLGMPDIVRTQRWRSIIPHMVEINIQFESWLTTRDGRIAKTNVKIQATRQAQQEATELKPEEKN